MGNTFTGECISTHLTYPETSSLRDFANVIRILEKLAVLPMLQTKCGLEYSFISRG